MNAVEIEEAISALAEQPFDREEFPFAFLQAFGNKETTIKRLRKGESNKSDLAGVLQTNNIHIAVAVPGEVTKTLAALKASPATARAKAKFVLATDGETFEAEDLANGETVACAYTDFPNHFGFFLPLAGITTVKQVRDSSFDIRATSRLNKLYVELLKDNPEWGTTERRPDMNHFMARLIFCFFAEDTDIFNGASLFTSTIEQMSTRDSSNTHEVIGALFLAMNTKIEDRAAANLPRWATVFPYVNGGLFSGSLDVPRFSRIARSYLLHIGNLDWTKINPDIFGSMIQAVADDDERGALGMHYTSMPNILKVLSPLFLDDLRARLEEAGDNARMLLNLRKRLAKIRVFDPACGSGNFLVIAYKAMRGIEAEINKRRGEADHRTEIPLTNFRGIELRDFPAEIARLALIIAEFQCDVLYRGQKEALAEFLPLDTENWITCGNALRLDWMSICPPAGVGVKHHAEDLFHTPLDQAQIDFENEGGETYICGNPPYRGSKYQTPDQKADLQRVFDGISRTWNSLDYVTGWIMKAARYSQNVDATSAFVCTNSICQGVQVPSLWPFVFNLKQRIVFAHTSFKWANLASRNAGVTVVVVGIGSNKVPRECRLFEGGDDSSNIVRAVPNINAYLVGSKDIIVDKSRHRTDELSEMDFGSKAVDGGHLYLDRTEKEALEKTSPKAAQFIRRVFGAAELVKGLERYCFWINDDEVPIAESIEPIAERLRAVRQMRLESQKAPTRAGASQPHKFEERRQVGNETIIALPRITSENRDYLPVGLLPAGTIVSSQLFSFYDCDLFYFSILASRLHWVWMGTVCGRLEMRFSYSNTLGWNTFPVPILTEKNKTDLERCAMDIILAREAHFPATIADLYDPHNMPADLREAHERNDEVLERIYIGRRFRNDTERLEKLFELYTKSRAQLKSRKAEASA
ncbi:class I SAM-dependent DNA methyltransferase [Bradyrhizobium sp. 38]|uniref:class I SAM-dependent DNA methyltransferase n=1 Tax=unclassified Bradyrhizobium TaxID=2631580 RepID=UPI001FF9B2CC|nr:MULTISPECIES: DNA methyltransferase [unclassified Bradyrhizobium]MCK1339791.1 class I SAM-dependent DNA methyltransferase [Bradyrhizobium sp. 38]MCK1782722.1 class I SAM-dependent DNA methyltransferase [Bradyrhizobium sp. 132]